MARVSGRGGRAPTQSDAVSEASRHTRATLGALPFAAAATLLAARALPIQFEYVDNPLGIVSLATLARYPQQQETFWLFAAVGCVGLLTWAGARWLLVREASHGLGARGEMLGAVALLATLWLPPLFALGVLIVCAAGLAFFAPRALPGDTTSNAGESTKPELRAGTGWLIAASLLLALALTSDFWANAWSVAHGFADEARAMNGFPFMGEIGQHLAWANALRGGEFHGKDFFCLYGPLYDLGLVGSWEIFGRSIVVWDLYFSLTRVLALAGLLTFAGLLLRQRVLILLLPFLVPWISLRSGWAFIGLCFMFAWLQRKHWSAAAAAGMTAGVSLLFSQEFGLAFSVVACLGFALQLSWRAAASFAVGAALVILPVFGWYAANDALLPMLREIVGYPAYIVAGYAKLPFPALAARIPFALSDWGSRELLAYQLGYGVPAICLGALLLVLPISKFDLRAPFASLGRIFAGLRADPTRMAVLLLAVFGMLAFRSALGRSDLKHMIDPLPAAALLLVVGLDRLWSTHRAAHLARPVAAWRFAALAILTWHVGFTLVPKPLHDLRTTLSHAELLRSGRAAVGDPRVTQVARWIQLETEVDEPVLFLPNNGAYYYLANRPSPIRFVMGHQIVTQAHRDEVLAELSADPPRYFVWDDAAHRVDGLSDEEVFGAPLLAWLGENYVEVERFGEVSIRRLRSAPARGDP
jgi:hypothetical protein